MKAIAYYIFAIKAWILSLLPLRILYAFSFLLYIVLYYISAYRRKVVDKNLRNSFPDKNEAEIRLLSKKFYKHLADMFIEGIKLRHMSEKELNKRFKLLNPELLNSYAEQGRSAIATFGHYGNWEWIVGIQSLLDHKVLTVYKPLHNQYFDRYFLNIRSRYGMEIIPMSSTLRSIISNKKEGNNTLTVLVADQTPPKGEIHYWIDFLNQDTPVYLGIEKLARKFDMAVFYFKIKKVKRGFYTVEAELITDDPTNMKEHELTDRHMLRLEEHILEQPEYWLWSHRRWKHKRSVKK